MHKAVGVVLKTRDGKFLLQWRDNKKEIVDPDTYSIFGGAIEPNESPEKAAIREMEEELELKLEEKHLKFIDMNVKGKDYQNYVFLYQMPVNQKELKLHEGQAIVPMTKKQILFNKKTCNETRLFFLLHKL